MRVFGKTQDTLWTLIAAPKIWWGYFLFCYFLAAYRCAPNADPFRVIGGTQMAVGIATVICLGLIALILRSAGHFATGCAACHGAPGMAQSPVVKAMVPAPPRLEGKVGEWTDAELFWIVKNGIEFSGMPAWPAQDRDDEVWAQVAFLRALPAQHDPSHIRGIGLGRRARGPCPRSGRPDPCRARRHLRDRAL